MIAAERQQRIYELALQRGAVRLADLVRELGATANTVRRDLRTLEAEGRLRCSHGGAVPAGTTGPLPAAPYAQTRTEHRPEKAGIGRAALAFLPEQGSVFLNAGSTTRELALRIPPSCRLHIGTNSPELALFLATRTTASVDLVGGRLVPESLETDGTLSPEVLSGWFWDVCFLGITAWDPERGITSISPAIARLERAILEHSRQRVVLCDSAKIGRFARAQVAPVTAGDVLITDSGLAAGWRVRLRKAGVELVIAEPGKVA